jgi:hypothetical protein
LERDFRQAVSGGRSPARAQLLAQRINSIARGMKDRQERRAWGETLHRVVLGKELYVTPQAPDQPQLDPCVREIYQLGIDLAPARQRFQRDFSIYLQKDRSLALARAMDARLVPLLAVSAADPKAHQAFLESMAPLLAGKETIKEPSGKIHKDPVVDRLVKSMPKKTALR